MNKKTPLHNQSTCIMNQGMPFQFDEAFKNLRTNLRYAAIDGNVKTILVTSSVAGEGKSTVAINLAVSLGQLFHRTLLIDADLRKPRIHHYLNLQSPKKIGVTIALAGLSPVKENVQRLEEYGIFAMPSGPSVPNPTEVLQSRAMSSLMEELRQNFDYIIIDTPPVSVVTDAAVLSPLADGVIFVIRQGFAPVDAVLNAKVCMENAKMHMLGCVLNVYSPGKSNHAGSSYYRGYHSSY